MAEGAANSSGQAQETAIQQMTNSLKNAFEQGKNVQNQLIENGFKTLDKTLFDTLDWFWTQWHGDLQAFARQLNAGIIDQTLQILRNMDASILSHNILREQKSKLAGKKLYQPNTQGGRFDTKGPSMGRSQRVSGAVATGFALDFNKVGNNDKNTAAGGGPASLQESRWDIYKRKFCDKDSNNGASGCVASGPAVNMHILPSKTIFGKDTFSTDEDTREALNQLLFNITGYETTQLIQPGAVMSTAGLHQQQENREYIAQMDAIGALAYSVVADRFPGREALDIQAVREKLGITNASDHPSAREIRQSLVEEVADPGYYVELYDARLTLPQKELYLKAYNLLMLNQLIAKQEKISNVYAIETANMLDQVDQSRHSVSFSDPQ